MNLIQISVAEVNRKDFLFHYIIQTDSGTQRTSCLMGTEDSLLEGKADGAWSWPLTSN
jgi:hypothetical protein